MPVLPGGGGGGTLISRLLGAREEAEARKVSVFSFYLGLVLAVAYGAGLGLLMEPALRFLGAEDTIIVYARQYAFCVIVLGAVPTVLSNVLSNLVRSVGLSKEAGFGITLGAVLNIILDPVFMYLILPEGQQVLGVGIATFVSNCVAFLYFMGIMWKIRRSTVLTISPAAGLPGLRSIGQVFWVGVPSAVTSFLFQGFGKGGISLVLAIARWAVFNIPMIFLLNHLVGMYGIIWSPIVGGHPDSAGVHLRLPHPETAA